MCHLWLYADMSGRLSCTWKSTCDYRTQLRVGELVWGHFWNHLSGVQLGGGWLQLQCCASHTCSLQFLVWACLWSL